MTEELEQLLKNLKLRRMLSVYDEQLRVAEQTQVSYSEFVAGLLRSQWHDRQESALEWRIRRADMPDRWSLETFPWSRQPSVNRKQIRAFAELDFIAKHENLVFVGETGVGKTGLASGLLLKALQNGYRCQFICAQDLFDEMYASLADRSTRQLLNRLARLDVLLIDEFGYLNLKPEQSNIFFKLMEERYHRHSTIITTNLIYESMRKIKEVLRLRPMEQTSPTDREWLKRPVLGFQDRAEHPEGSGGQPLPAEARVAGRPGLGVDSYRRSRPDCLKDNGCHEEDVLTISFSQRFCCLWANKLIIVKQLPCQVAD